MAKDKTVELKPKADKISEEHLKELQQLVNSVNKAQMDIGRIESQKHNLLHNIAISQDKIQLFGDTLRKEYGTDNVNIMDGTINWEKDEK